VVAWDAGLPAWSSDPSALASAVWSTTHINFHQLKPVNQHMATTHPETKCFDLYAKEPAFPQYEPPLLGNNGSH
jgi:hypothetical protein